MDTSLITLVENPLDKQYIFNIGSSNINTKTIIVDKKYTNKFYSYPFGTTRTRFARNDPFDIKWSNNEIFITKNNNSSSNNGWNINLKIWYPPDVKLSELNIISLIPFNYGIIQKYNLEKEHYKYGLVIPFFSRADYVQQFLTSLQKSDLSDCLMVFVDESMTKDVDDDHVSVNSMISSFVGNNLIKIYKNKHGNMFDSILTGWDVLYRYCDFMVTLDSDTLVKENWLEKITESFITAEQDSNNDFILCSGFNVESQRHYVIEKRDIYIIKGSVGGCNMFFRKKIYPDYIRRTLISHKWDTNIISYIKELNGIFVTTNPSVIQHIGKVSSGHRNDVNTSWDHSNDYE